MGVNAVVIVANQRRIGLNEFIEQLAGDRYGLLTLRDIASEDEERGDDQRQRGWLEFTWQGQRYFSWIHGPRAKYLDLYREEASAPNPGNAAQITFLRIMAVLEKAADGPVCVGNDVVNSVCPDSRDDREEFYLPLQLDDLISDWRAAGAVESAQTRLVF